MAASVRDLNAAEPSWTTGLKLEIVKALSRFEENDSKLLKLTPEQAWRLHLKNDHVPFWKDYEQCVLASGTGKRHVSVKAKSCYTMSMEVTGPFPRLHRSLDAEANLEDEDGPGSKEKPAADERATTMCDPESLVSRIHDGHKPMIAILPPCNISTELPKCLRCSVVPFLGNDRVDDDMPRFVLLDGLPCLSNGLHDLLPIPSASQDWLSW